MLREEIFENVVLSAGSIVEITKLPVVILNGPELKEKKQLARDPDRIVAIDIENEKAVYEVPPRWYDLHFDVNVSCKNNVELLSLIENFSRLSQRRRLLTAENEKRERKYTWGWHSIVSSAVNPNISQVYQGHGEIVIFDVEVYSDIQEIWPLIQKVSIGIDKDNIEVQA